MPCCLTGVPMPFKSVAFWRVARLIWLTLLMFSAPCIKAQELSEYRIKVAFLYNFALYTEWPDSVGKTLTLCIHGADPFGKELDELQGKRVGGRQLVLQRKASIDMLKECQLVFLPAQAIARLPRVLDELVDHPTLVVTDSPGAARQGAALNMVVNQQKITFEANWRAARAARLKLSSNLLRLATDVYQ